MNEQINCGSYRELIVWQRAMALTVAVYTLTKYFPKEELYGLSSQMKRSAVSIPSNIAEGKRRCSPREFKRFLLIAFASGAELETQVELSKMLKLAPASAYDNVENALNEVMKMLNKLISRVKDATSYSSIS